MANMSYCRFRNTLNDFRDCVNALQDIEYENEVDISNEELKAAEKLMELAFGIVDELGFVTQYGEFNYEECRIFFERLKDGCQ